MNSSMFEYIESKERLNVEDYTSLRHIRLHTERYVFSSQFVKDKIVLDIACGCGYGSNYLAKKGVHMVVGGDISKKTIYDAVKYYHSARAGIHYLVLDAHKLPFKDNSFDVVVSFETIEHLHRYGDFLRECRRVLKNNGVFICSTPNKAAHSKRSPYHIHEFYIDEFRLLLKKYFKEVTLYGYYPVLKKEPKSGIENIIKRLILSLLPTKMRGLINLFAKLPPFRGYRVTKLAEIHDFDKINSGNDKRYIPVLIQANSSLFAYIIAIANL